MEIPGVFTTYMGKPEIPDRKSNGSFQKIWVAIVIGGDANFLFF